MRVAATIMIACLLPFLAAATSLENQAPKSDAEKKAALELFVHQLDAVCDSQIQELALIFSHEEVEKLRRSHYEWKLARDLRCKEVGLTEAGKLRELECLADMTEKYYEARENEIVENADLEQLLNIPNI